MIEKTQLSFIKYISGMQGLSYPERHTALKLYSLQRRRDRYIIIYVLKMCVCDTPIILHLAALKHIPHVLPQFLSKFRSFGSVIWSSLFLIFL